MARGVFRAMLAIYTTLYRLTSGRIGGQMRGLRVLLLTTKGRRTGKERTVPLGTFEDGGGYVVIASNSGSDAHPGWFFNLRSDPQVRIQIGSEALRAEARVVEGTERARLWQKLVTLSPGYAAYQKRTKRVIPLIALRRSG